MSYYVDDGSGRFREFDSNDLQGAKYFAELSIQSAKEFCAKMGFVPFWGKVTEIRKGKARLAQYNFGEPGNTEIMENTKLFKLYSVQQ